jgi:mono/diheme cytochrome c family protein
LSSDRSVWTRAVAASALSGLLAACGGLSDAGDQDSVSPTAVAHVVGYDGPDSAGNVAIDVRAQSELALTGKESIDADKPIISFLWEPANAAANSATLTVRNSSTVSVSVPRVSVPTEIQFRLTVTDSDGDSDTATVTLRVQPVLDSDRFLQYVRDIAKLRVVAGTAQPLATPGEFEVQLRAHVTYRARSGNLNTVHYDVGSPIRGTWLTSVDATDNGHEDFRNPLFQFGIPGVDLDAITRQFQATLPGSAASVADPAFVDDATLELSILLTPVTATPDATLYALNTNGAVVKFAANNGTGAPVELQLTAAEVNELRITGGGLENEDTAKSYYNAIDPNESKLTLQDWLVENCFDPSAEDFGADAHAVYVNNFDLGFGRDMYFRTSRPANCTSASFAPGNAASVVINYLTLEAAVKKIDPVIAVAMEYEAVDTDRSTPGRVTFYAFAPDQSTGEFRRVRTVNFDGRGEKFLPGACTACHGGRPKPPAANRLATYSATSVAGGDVGATFMPWDLESFLYSDTDSTFPTDASNASLRAQFTRGQQETEFKKLNLAAYETYGHGSGTGFQCYDTNSAIDFTGPCELVGLWYGGAGTPSATFLDRQTAPGWLPGGANPASSQDLYLDVFARNCRACHVQRVTDGPQFPSYSKFIDSSGSIIEQVFDIGGMPAARLTMDRFWLPDADQVKSAGQLLAEHLDGLPGPPDLPEPTPPGDAVACFEGTPLNLGDEATPVTISRGEQLTFSSECSNFASSFEWQLDRPGTSTATLTADQSIRTAFTPDKAGIYGLTLSVSDRTGAVTSLTKYGIVINQVPIAADLSRTVDLSVPMAIDVLAAATNLGDEPTTVQIDGISGAGLSAVLEASQRIVVTASDVAGGTVNYSITDFDGGPANTDSGVITVTVAATITANDLPSESVNANTASNQIELTGLIAAQGQAVVVSIVSIPATSLVGTLGMRGTVSIVPCTGNPQNSCASYSPPIATISRFGGTAVGSPDTFEYQACFSAQPTNCDSGTVTVQINGQFPFAPVATMLENNCVACHANPGIVQPGSVWTLASGATEKEAWCAVALPNQAGSEAGGLYSGDSLRTMINPADPPESLLNLKPSAALNHGIVPQGPLLTADELTAIRNWIGEGGAFTSGPSQTCP